MSVCFEEDLVPWDFNAFSLEEVCDISFLCYSQFDQAEEPQTAVASS